MQTVQEYAQALAKHVQVTDSESDYLEKCSQVALTLVTDYLGKVSAESAPAVVVDRAVLEVAADLYWRREAQNGIATFGGGETNVETVHIGIDPLRPARPLLTRYVGPGIA